MDDSVLANETESVTLYSVGVPAVDPFYRLTNPLRRIAPHEPFFNPPGFNPANPNNLRIFQLSYPTVSLIHLPVLEYRSYILQKK